MDDSLKQSWTVFSSRYRTFFCPFCKSQGFNFDEPKQYKFDGNDVIAVTCLECGHIELFDVNQMIKAAIQISQKRRHGLF